jgi:hypothetical protein
MLSEMPRKYKDRSVNRLEETQEEKKVPINMIGNNNLTTVICN